MDGSSILGTDQKGHLIAESVKYNVLSLICVKPIALRWVELCEYHQRSKGTLPILPEPPLLKSMQSEVHVMISGLCPSDFVAGEL